MADTQTEIDQNDPAALAALFTELESGVPEPAPDTKTEDDAKAALEAATKAEEEAKAKQAAEEQAKTEADAKAKADADKEPDGVATKDGKHIIPYSVLQADRARAAAAEKALADMQAKFADLEKAKDGVAPAAKTEVDAGELTAEELAAMKEDFPIQYKMHMAMQAQLKALQASAAKVGEDVQEVQSAHRRTESESVQDAIDATPKLAHVMATDPAAFASARQYDDALKANPAWAAKPLAERFAKVMEMVELTHGPITVPGQKAATPVAAAPVKTADEMKAEAKAVAEAAAKAGKTTVPTSLTEFAAGEHAAESGHQAIESMSPIQLAAHFASMTPDKLEAYLNNPS